MNLPSIEVLFVVFLVRVISAPFKKNHVSYISEFTPFVSVTLTDGTCGTLYFGVKKDHYLVWDGSHIGKDSLINLWVESIVKKDSGSCKVTFDPAVYYTVCVTVEKFHIEDCDATVNYYHNGDTEIKAVRVLFSVQIMFI